MDKRQKLYIIIPLSVAVLVALVYFAALPAFQTYQNMRSQLDALQAKVTSSRVIASSLGSEKVKYDRAKIDLEKFNKLFETEMRDGSNVILLGLKAAATKVNIQSIVPGDIVEKTNYLEMPLNITAQGNYPNMLAFCTDIERLPNLSDVRVLKILSVPAADSSSNVTVNMDVIIFSAKTPQERLGMEEIKKWAIGRSNLFQPANGASLVPVPGASPYLTTPPNPLNAAALMGKGR